MGKKRKRRGGVPSKLPDSSELRFLLGFQSRGVIADRFKVKESTVERALLRDAKEAA
jgi:hypothetical protein